MKTKLSLRAQCAVTLAAAVLVAGCVQVAHTDDADGKQVTVFVPAPPAFPTTPTPDNADGRAAGPPASVAVIKKFDPDAIKLSTGIQEVVNLAQAGVNETVIKAFIEKSNIPYNPSADEIIFLTDIGLPNIVITAMLQQGNKVAEQNARNPQAPRYEQPPAIPTAPVVPPAPAVTVFEPAPPYVAPPQPPAAAQPPPAEVTQFYSSLAPYGSWMNVSDLGWCWQPQVAVYRSDWRPYGDRGRWLYSDVGWYWQSDYSWGWAPFHYGRWTQHHRIGWVWTPDTVWGPAWVTWRYTDGYCGWAPLPHHAVFEPGIGLFFRGSHVSIGFDFGLSWNHFTFIGSDRFCDSNPRAHYLPASRVENIYQQTTVINNYNITSNNTVINNGIPASQIPAVARQEVRKVSVREMSPANQTQVAPDRVQQSGATPVIYRPQSPKAMAQAAENPASRVHTELAKKAITTTEQRLAIPASSITTTGQRLGTPASSITPMSPRPVVTPQTRTTVEPQPAAKPVAPTVKANPPQSAPTGASTTVRPFDQPTTPSPSRTVVTPRAIPAPGLHSPDLATPRPETTRPNVITPQSNPTPTQPKPNPVTPRFESPRLPIYTPQPAQPNPTPVNPRSEPARSSITPPEHVPAGRPTTSFTAPQHTEPVRPAPSYTVPTTREVRPFQSKQVENQPRIMLKSSNADLPSYRRPTVVPPSTERSGQSPEKDPANPTKRQ